jgi:protein TonB
LAGESSASPGEEGEGEGNQGGFSRSGQGRGPFSWQQVDHKPEAIYAPRPIYPHLAQRRGIEGWVEVSFLVSREGLVSREEVVQAQPEGVFENSALQALRAWRFSPGIKEGAAVDTWVVQVIRFKLARTG